MARRIFIALILCALCASFSYAQASKYKVQPMDVLSITVHAHPDLTTKTRITTEGNITFPLLGKVNVTGLTAQEVEQKLKQLLEKDYLVTAQVLVFIESYHPTQVAVIGKVNNPGKYEMPKEKDTTLLEAIAMAGGFTKDSDRQNVKVIRVTNGVQKTMLINTKDITTRGEKNKDIVIEPGDIISVPEGFSRVSVLGEVNKPGEYEIPEEKVTTLLESIAMAGGFTKDADKKNVSVMRIKDGRQVTIAINASDIKAKGEKGKDIPIEPGDIVSVKKGFSRVSVLGEVNKPGEYEMPEEKVTTLLEAIAMAGGFTPDADKKEIKVMRVVDGQQKTIVVNAKNIKVKGERGKDIIIEPGDIVSVPQGFFRISVLGEVNKPGEFQMPEEKETTLLEAIAMAGGFTKDADIGKVKIMRNENGQRSTIVINVKDIKAVGDRSKDIVLQPGDIVEVPESFF